jgi:hypothetical protein
MVNCSLIASISVSSKNFTKALEFLPQLHHQWSINAGQMGPTIASFVADIFPVEVYFANLIILVA